MARLKRTGRAETDLVEIWNYIALSDPGAADRLLDRLREASQMLARNPEGGTPRTDLGSTLRFFPVGNYLLFYESEEDGIIIVRVLHGARDYRREFL